ncbi:hypothetical protein FRB90_002205 [Tulasnella sp. 427]|nr:hypothetical protein FRB90_002205 [Tulasnella sp. 427]
MPQTRLPVVFAEFAEKYGPLTYPTVPVSTILIVNAYEAARELLDKRAALYADRPRMVMMGEPIGVEKETQMKRYDTGWRLQRKYLKQVLSANGVKANYVKLLENAWVEYLKSLISVPDHFLANLTSMIGQTVIDSSYGRHTDDEGNDYLKRLKYVQELVVGATFGYIVDLAPFLKHLPSWLSGMQFKRDAARWKAETDETRNLLFSRAIKDVYERGSTAQPSYTINALKQLRDADVEMNVSNPYVEAIKHSGFAFYSAGSETTEFTFRSLLLAMILFPEVQSAARAEIDRVIGKDRLPAFEDRENTPYHRAMVLESLRWNPAGPVGVPHRLMKDDMFEGYLLPKGTSVFPSIWSETRLTLRNPKYFKDPSSFKPERHMEEHGETELDPRRFVFGFGGRICPGSELALQSIRIGIAMILWAFELKPAEEGPKLRSDLDRFKLGNLR